MLTQDLYPLFLKCNAVSTDTRKIGKGAMFFALKGDRFDANTFTEQALAQGASYVVLDNPDYCVDERTILVPDTLLALQQLAAFHRNSLNLPVIGLTGSNGKTTTKELIRAVLSQKYVTGATKGNLNNHIGVPLTLLSFTAKTQIGIVEMGANHQKEIEFLCEIARPDYGYITNFGKAHLEGFGGFEGVVKGKSELYDYLRKSDKKAIVNLDDVLQKSKTSDLRRYTFSCENQKADVFLSGISADPFVTLSFGGLSIASKLIGIYNAANIGAAITFGCLFDIGKNLIKTAIETYSPDNNRSQLTKKGSNDIILDAYNANPSSMKAALTHFLQADGSGKIAFLGDMFELGNESAKEHKALIDFVSSYPETIFYFVGKEFYKHRLERPKLHFFEDVEGLSTHFKKQKPKNSTILIKGSRGMALERLLDVI